MTNGAELSQAENVVRLSYDTMLIHMTVFKSAQGFISQCSALQAMALHQHEPVTSSP